MSISVSEPVIFDKRIGYLALAVSLPSVNGTVDTILTSTVGNKNIVCYNRYTFQANDKIEPFPNFISFINDDAYFSTRSFDGQTAASGCLDTYFVTAPLFATLTIETDAFNIRFTYPNDSKNTNYNKFDDVIFRQTQSQNSLWENKSFYFSSQNVSTFYLPWVNVPKDETLLPTLDVYNIFQVKGTTQDYTLYFQVWKINDETLLTTYDATKYSDPTKRSTALEQLSGQNICSLQDPIVLLIPIFATKRAEEVPLFFYIFDPSIQSIPPESFQLFEETIINSLGSSVPFRVPDDVTYFIFGFLLFKLPSGVQNNYISSPGITSNIIMGFSKVATTTEQTFTCSEFLNETCANLPCQSSDTSCNT